MLIHLFYLWLGGILGFLFACFWIGPKLHEMRQHLDWYANVVKILNEERKPPKKVNRMGEMILSDQESDAVWESIFGPSPWEIDQ